MCEFISWIDVRDYKVTGGSKYYYLKNTDLDTSEGAKLLDRKLISDINGHGAIMNYFKSLNGCGNHRECENFSRPKNFPAEIADAFKRGKMSMIGINSGAFTKEAKGRFEVFEYKCKGDLRKKISDLSEANQIKIRALEKAHLKKIKAHNKKYPVTCVEDKKARARYSKKQKEILNHKYDIRENTFDRDTHAFVLENKIAIAKRFTNIIKLKKNRNKNWQ